MSPEHPITPIPVHDGKLGLCGCPGVGGALAGRSRPDAGLDALARWRAGAVVTLMESRELEMLGLEILPEACRERFGAWLHLPIRDCDIPGPGWMEGWQMARLVIAALLSEGDNVAVHCLAGVGRTGTVASMLLVDAGFGTGRQALEHVRGMHNIHAAETPEQEAFVERYQPAFTLDRQSAHHRLAEATAAAGLEPVINEGGRVDRERAVRLVG